MEEKTLQEVVLTYCPADRREVVEIYRRELPVSMQARPAQPPRKRRGKRGLVIFLVLLALAAALAGVAWWLGSRDSGPAAPGDFAPPDKAEEITMATHPWGQGITLDLAADHGEELTIQEVYRQVNPAVVMVSVDLGNSMSVGTGVLFREDGYLLTNYHVVEGGKDCAITLDTGYTYPAKFVAGDRNKDLAVLKADQTGLPAAAFGNSNDLVVGDTVYAIGNPLGFELRGTLTDGIVSAIDRDVMVDDQQMTLIQTNAALNVGNSGGPLINVYGQVVGINTIKMGSDLSSVEGLGFAIPSVSVEELANELLTYGELQPNPVLGISVGIQATDAGDGTLGLEVVTITEGSPADREDIRVGDYLLTANGRRLRTSSDLLQVRDRCRLGDELTLTLWRDGEVRTVTLLLDQAVEE